MNIFIRRCLWVWIAVLSASSAHATDKSSTFGKVERTTVGGNGGWDLLAVEPARHRLFISRSDRVMVFDTEANKVINEISGTAGVHGIAIADELGLGFTSNGQSNSVTVFDLKSLNVVQEIKGMGENPDAIVYDAHSKRVFCFNGRGQNVTVINAVTKSIVSNIALPGKPELAVSDGRGHIFVNLEDKNSIARIDIATSTVSATWTMEECESPTGLAIDAKHQRLFSVCENHKMAIVDAVSGKTINHVAIGGGPDGVAFDNQRALIISSNGEGNLSVIHEESADHFKPVATIATQKGARTITIDEVHHIAYSVTAEFGPVPPATPDHPHPRPSQVADTFMVLAVHLAGGY